LFENGGLEAVRQKLKELDPVHFKKVDLNNKQRVMHEVEVCLMLVILIRKY
jgi:tRNA dimethylallyltransferase